MTKFNALEHVNPQEISLLQQLHILTNKLSNTYANVGTRFYETMKVHSSATKLHKQAHNQLTTSQTELRALTNKLSQTEQALTQLANDSPNLKTDIKVLTSKLTDLENEIVSIASKQQRLAKSLPQQLDTLIQPLKSQAFDHWFAILIIIFMLLAIFYTTSQANLKIQHLENSLAKPPQVLPLPTKSDAVPITQKPKINHSKLKKVKKHRLH